MAEQASKYEVLEQKKEDCFRCSNLENEGRGQKDELFRKDGGDGKCDEEQF